MNDAPTRSSDTGRTSASIQLVSPDEDFHRRIRRIVPDSIAIDSVPSLQAVDPTSTPFALILYQTDRLDKAESERIDRFLRSAPRRLAILAREADPGVVYRLTVIGTPLGLLAIESLRSDRRLQSMILRWFLSGWLQPDWKEVGVTEEVPYVVARFQRLIEGDPAHDWRVAEVAERLRVSRSTLDRAARQGFGRGAKSLLMEMRHQLIERARAADLFSTREMAELFEFDSSKQLLDWRTYYKSR